MFMTPAFAQATGGGGGMDMVQSLVPILLMFGIFYFLLIRPQQQKVKQHRELVSGVRRGDKVVTSGGILGKVTKVIDDGTVEVEIADNVRIKVLKGTLSDVQSKTEPVKETSGGSSS